MSFIRFGRLLWLCACFGTGYACKDVASNSLTSTEDRSVETAEKTSISEDVLILGQVIPIKNSVDPRWELDSQKLGAEFQALLLNSGRMVIPNPHEVTTAVSRRMEVRLFLSSNVTMPSASTSGTVIVALEAITRFVDGGDDVPSRAAVMTEISFHDSIDKNVKSEVHKGEQKVLRAASSSLIAQEKLRRADNNHLLVALTGDDLTLRLWAMKMVAERKLKAAVPAMIGDLSHVEERIRNQAITSLVAIGDRSAVPAMTQIVDFKDHRQLETMIEAMSAIGGGDAVAFLEFIASGHEDSTLRRRASESLGRLGITGQTD